MSSPLPAENNSPPGRTPRPTWPIILGLTALVAVPLLVWEIPREKQRWKVATAVQERLDGEQNHAYELLDEVIEDDPQNVPVLLLRAQWQLEDEQGDRALADVNQALAQRPDDEKLLEMRSQVLQATGHHAQAIEDADAILRRTIVNDPFARATNLNRAAYARAIGDLELEQALVQVEEALKQVPGNAAVLDTRGFILYRLKRYKDALPDLNAAAEDVAQSLTAWEEKNRRSYSRGGGDAAAASKRLYRNAAVIYYHRGLVHEALGNKEAAEKDFAQVKAWGCEPEEQLY